MKVNPCVFCGKNTDRVTRICPRCNLDILNRLEGKAPVRGERPTHTPNGFAIRYSQGYDPVLKENQWRRKSRWKLPRQT